MNEAGADDWTASGLRLRRLRDRLHDRRLDGLLVSHLPNIRYLSGFTGSSGLLLVEPGSCVLLTDFRYEEQAAGEAHAEVVVRIVRDGLFGGVAQLLDARSGPLRYGFEEDHLTVRDRRALGERCGGAVWEPVCGVVEGLRRSKGPAEVSRIEAAARLAEGAFAELLPKVAEGETEHGLATDLEHLLRRGGSGPLPFEPIVASGPRSALPHARPTARRLEAGDLLLVDFGARVDGYCSDLTRVAVLGSAADWQRELHGHVEAALEAALQRVAAGAPVAEVDRAARGRLEEAGLAERFGHSTGHGVGLEVHEGPRVYGGSEETLEAGDVVTVEPGVYLPGRGGIRLEELVLVGAEGARPLTRFPRRLIEL